MTTDQPTANHLMQIYNVQSILSNLSFGMSSTQVSVYRDPEGERIAKTIYR